MEQNVNPLSVFYSYFGGPPHTHAVMQECSKNQVVVLNFINTLSTVAETVENTLDPISNYAANHTTHWF